MPTALLSVYDKTGIVDLAATLADHGWSLVSSGGTAAAIADAGIEVTDVANLTGFPPMLDHRVVTLHPTVHGAILADLTNPTHRADLEQYGIEPISLVVVNLYPFGADPGIELIDIGGPAMVRAAAKNHAHVAVVVNPTDYAVVASEIAATGEVSVPTRKRLARDAFARTAAYDAEIVSWLDSDTGDDHDDDHSVLPSRLYLALERADICRYGENPHQAGARYRRAGATSWWDTMVQHGGKQLSYLNFYDTEAAWRLVNRFDGSACVIVKHANPCGVALGVGDDPIADAYVKANASDPVSAFGGIVAVNGPVTVSMAIALSKVFTEVVIAPSYEPDALAILTAAKNLRVITAEPPGEWECDLKPLDGGFVVQQPDPISTDRSGWTVVTDRAPTDHEWDELAFAWIVVAAVTSNAIVYTRDRQAVGIGAGQPSRLDSARIAAEKAGERSVGGVCASDAFFPFRDGLDAAVAAGVTAVIQPGGSVRDDEVIAAANEAGIAMVFTGQRHFRH
ncbi:MAG: bifunctional phosphoribosylaminoimidazolecarboxamide formyltransferase/inosine monophosphate cyclohydrolase [Ilumatobacter coccineus]|uniref:Bifunctional purine biosynthesis protein PurH n=1 Tax=Ilumatobacter coccineus TaxID=467094 RepID=A0A2G6KA27_9ACTN|nr:MAG: bifunctional phosphoribosylaminoimidazolecarboxamide formyltransferase/inosine monophosphate cyclohydrolase [Ilumatobacter coccineus]